MENKNTGTKVVNIILIILVLGLSGYLVYDKLISKDNNKNETNNSSENETVTLKLDESMEYVYDAKYDANVTKDSYSIGEKTYYVKDIVVPYININSEYARKSNEEIKKVFDNAIAKYSEGVENNSSYVDECVYKKNISNDFASVVLTYSVGRTDIPVQSYYTYNIDLKNGNKLSYKQVYEKLGFTSDNIDTKVGESIKKYMNDKYSDLINSDNIDKSIQNYEVSVSEGTIKYFVDNNKLNIIVTINIPAGRENYDKVITIE